MKQFRRWSLWGTALVVMFGAFAANSASASGTSSDTLQPGKTLCCNNSLVSKNGSYWLTMQAADGNLVVYGPGHVAIWASNTAGNPNAYLAMQSDGNVVIYKSDHRTAVFSTTTYFKQSYLIMQNDGNAVNYMSDHRTAAWASKSKGEAAISWFHANLGSTGFEGLCERAVRYAFGNVAPFYSSALDDWNHQLHHTPFTSAPRGTAVFYKTSANWHVALAIGNGQIMSTSVGGKIGQASISYFTNPQGWAYAAWGKPW